MDIKELIELMSGASDGNEPVGSKTASWAAYRKAEQLDDVHLIPELKAYIAEEGNKATRKYAYVILEYIGKNTRNFEVADILIDQLEIEDQHHDNLHNVLDALYTLNFPLQKGLEEMLIYAFDERELIRTTAIQLLSRYTIEHQKIKDTLLEVVEYHYDEYDLRYAVESLQALFPDDYKKLVHEKIRELTLNQRDENIITSIKNSIS